jgi:hypothetical protein
VTLAVRLVQANSAAHEPGLAEAGRPEEAEEIRREVKALHFA